MNTDIDLLFYAQITLLKIPYFFSKLKNAAIIYKKWAI